MSSLDYRLEVLEIGAGLEPLGGVAGDLIGPEHRGDDGGHPGSVLEEPVLLEDPGDGLRRGERVAVPGGAGEDVGLGEVWEGQRVHGGLLGAERRRDRAVHLRAPHDGYQRHRRRPQLLRVVLHGRPAAAAARLPGQKSRVPEPLACGGRRGGGSGGRGGGELGSVMAVGFVWRKRTGTRRTRK